MRRDVREKLIGAQRESAASLCPLTRTTIVRLLGLSNGMKDARALLDVVTMGRRGGFRPSFSEEADGKNISCPSQCSPNSFQHC